MNGWLLPSVAIIAVTSVLIAALTAGVNGVLLGSGLTILGGLGGFFIGKRKS